MKLIFYSIARRQFGYTVEYGVFTKDGNAKVTQQVSNEELRRHAAVITNSVVKQYIKHYSLMAESGAA